MDFDDIILDKNDISIDTELLESDLVAIDQVLPSKLYIIPIRYRPIFPGIKTRAVCKPEPLGRIGPSKRRLPVSTDPSADSA